MWAYNDCNSNRLNSLCLVAHLDLSGRYSKMEICIFVILTLQCYGDILTKTNFILCKTYNLFGGKKTHLFWQSKFCCFIDLFRFNAVHSMQFNLDWTGSRNLQYGQRSQHSFGSWSGSSQKVGWQLLISHFTVLLSQLHVVHTSTINSSPWRMIWPL